MSPNDEYIPPTMDWVRQHVDQIEDSGGTEGTTMQGVPVVVLTHKGAKSGAMRKSPVIRVEHDGRYAAVASLGGAPNNPAWYHNLRVHPRVQVQDGTTAHEMLAREVTGDEKAAWWRYAAEVFPNYDEYQSKTDREIPVFVLEPAQ
jgi:deazaflavin-dependent oxidoreductase (nitroreductase family)